ncbi:MAG TPA: hypothetical protein VM347_31725, partial [Nonomuraea sp.]|nr:hypothetical protein [Nonomuraea sp.]
MSANDPARRTGKALRVRQDERMPAAPEPRPPGGPGSMSLLVDMATAALDPEYQDARSRRPVGAPSRKPARRRRALVIGRVPVVLTTLLLLAGLVTGIAASQVREKAKETSAARQSLVSEVRSQT